MFVLHPNTNTIVLPLTPLPPAASVPEIVNDEPGVGLSGVAEAVSMVETGVNRDPVLSVRVTEPVPVNETVVGSFELAHTNPPVQVQLENV
jgi:hypothetical protein